MNRPGHGPDDFEERLRAALRRRADEVAPDPRLWGLVRERATRRRASRWFGAVAAVTPLLAAVGVAIALGLPERDPGVDLADLGPTALATAVAPSVPVVVPPDTPPPPSPAEVAPPVTLAETAPAPAAAEPPPGGAPPDRDLVLATAPGLVVADANAETVDVVLTEPASQPGECAETAGCEAEVVSDLHARPGSSGLDIAVTFLESFEPCLGEARVAIRRYGTDAQTDAGAIDQPDDLCPAAPVWSPDGTRLAWLERSADGGLDLVTVPFEGDTAVLATASSRAAIASDLPLNQMASAKIVEWAPDAAGATMLYVTAEASAEERVLLSMPVATGRGGAEPSGLLTTVSATADEAPYLTYAADGESGPAFLVRLRPAQDGRPTPLELVREDGESVAPPPPLDLPVELVDPVAPHGELVWLRARGGEVLFGDGVDQAWRVRWDGVAWSPMEVLRGAIRSADFLDPAGS